MKKILSLVLLVGMVGSLYATEVPTKSRTARILAGNVVMETYDLSFTSVTGAGVTTGLSNIYACIYSPSTSDNHGIAYKNSASASETEDDSGVCYIDSVTSSDNGVLLVIGAP